MSDVQSVLRSLSQLRSKVRSWRAFGERVALVPVLGPVHEGHIALVSEAQRDGQRVAACLVDAGPCLLPRDTGADLARLAETPPDAVFVAPPGSLSAADTRTRLALDGLTDVLCGSVEPGCFDGAVMTLLRLANQAQPDALILSDAHWQLSVLMSQLAGDLGLPAEIRITPALRTEDGLPVSADLDALPEPARRVAGRLARTIRAAAGEIRAGAEPERICRAARDRLIDAGFEAVDYLDIRHAGTLHRVGDPATEGPARVFAAARLAGHRFVDSVAVA